MEVNSYYLAIIISISFENSYNVFMGIVEINVVLILIDTEIGSSDIVKETGCTVTYFVNTAESVASNGTKVTLHSRDLWAEFHKCTTEMIITKAGR